MSKQVILQPVVELVSDFNKLAVELNAFMSWASGMSEGGMASSGAQMSKQRLTEIRRLIRELRKKCPPAAEVILQVKDSGHFVKKGSIPLYFS